MFIDAAFHLTQFGFRIFPLLEGKKIPAVPARFGGRGCLDATDDEEIVADWARKYPRANIGIACGDVSACVVIDFDPRNGSDATVAALTAKKQTFPSTVTARTANGGTHLYYAYEPALKNSKSVLGEGIDVKTTGGYVVAPPSILEGGKHYAWERAPLGEHLPRMPIWIVEALRPRPAPIVAYNHSNAPKDIEPLVRFVSQTGDGGRNNALFWAACRAAETGQLDGAARAAFEQAAISSGLDRKSVLKTLDSAQKKKKLT